MTGTQFLAGTVMGYFLFSTTTRLALGFTQPSIQWAARAYIPGLGHEVNYSPPPSAKVKNAQSCISTPSIHLHGVLLSWAQGLHLYLAWSCHDTGFMLLFLLTYLPQPELHIYIYFTTFHRELDKVFSGYQPEKTLSSSLATKAPRPIFPQGS
jgi:hypothetical protein